MLSGFKKQGLIHKEVSPRDGRQSILRLSETGLETYRMLNSRSQKEIETMLGELTEHDQNRLVNAMRTIQRLLDPEKAVGEAYTLRPPQPGDLGLGSDAARRALRTRIRLGRKL